MVFSPSGRAGPAASLVRGRRGHIKKPPGKAESEKENIDSARQILSVGLNALSPMAEGFFTGTRHFFAALLGGTQEKITMEPGKKILPGGCVFL